MTDLVDTREHLAADEAAFRDLYDRLLPGVYGYLAHRCGDRELAMDLTQEVFMAVYAGLHTIRQDASMAAWVCTVARNLAIDWVRQRAREQRRQAEEPAWWMLPDVARTPEQELLHRQDLARIAAVLAELSPEARLAVEMHRFGGYTLSEIAARLNVSVPTVHRLVRDALVKIAVRLGAQSEE